MAKKKNNEQMHGRNTKKKGVMNPTSKQLSEVKKQAAEEYHAKLFLYLTDQQRYGKAIEDMENNVLDKLYPFPKNVSEACRYLIKWHNNYGGRSVQSEANDGVAYTTVSDEKEEPEKSGKKKEITCFRCKKVGHYASECKEELPQNPPNKGSNMLILDEDSSMVSGQSKDYDYYDSTETAEVENYNHDNEPELQENEEAADRGQVLDKPSLTKIYR